jgi:hypothetical protein
LVVTLAVIIPTDVGFVESVTVRTVAVAVVTVPTAPLLSVTVLFDAVVSKPNPLIVIVDAFATRLAVLTVTTGCTVAIFTAEPLETLLTVTTAVRSPTAVGLVENVTVSEVAVAVVTVPTAPLLKTTEFKFAVELNPAPVITTDVALIGKDVLLFVTTGVTVATCTAVPLAIVLVVTIAVILPRTLGRVESDTVSVVSVAAVTVPTAPLLKTTVLRFATGSKPKPLIVMDVDVIPRPEVLLVTTGTALATLTAAPLDRLFVVTTAVRLLLAIGFVLSVTVNDVAVAAVTLPTAPLLRTTVLFEGVGSKPKPVIVRVAAFASRLPLVEVTTGVTVAT